MQIRVAIVRMVCDTDIVVIVVVVDKVVVVMRFVTVIVVVRCVVVVVVGSVGNAVLGCWFSSFIFRVFLRRFFFPFHATVLIPRFDLKNARKYFIVGKQINELQNSCEI